MEGRVTEKCPDFQALCMKPKYMYCITEHILQDQPGSKSTAFKLAADVSSTPNINGNFVHLYMSVAKMSKMLSLNVSCI